MQESLKKDGCLYQDDVVDYLVKGSWVDFLKDNADGNLVLTPELTNAFKRQTVESVVWVKSFRYWRYRVPEDESGREARG